MYRTVHVMRCTQTFLLHWCLLQSRMAEHLVSHRYCLEHRTSFCFCPQRQVLVTNWRHCNRHKYHTCSNKKKTYLYNYRHIVNCEQNFHKRYLFFHTSQVSSKIIISTKKITILFQWIFHNEWKKWLMKMHAQRTYRSTIASVAALWTCMYPTIQQFSTSISASRYIFSTRQVVICSKKKVIHKTGLIWWHLY